ncbi:MAG: tryptophan 2,3-dioxygenase family protein [Pirellulaceae bacterium]
MSNDSKRMPRPIQYSEYLHLDKLLNAQHPESARYGAPAHDELLFIVVHQAYELWFKQIVHEFESVIDIFDNKTVEDKEMGQIIGWLSRVKTIQGLLLQQIDVLETMTPLDFLDFRDLLVPASGFQSIQFKKIEIMMGIRRDQRISADKDFFKTRLTDAERAELLELESKPSLLELTDAWLARMPFLQQGEYEFWKEYEQAVARMLDSDRYIIQNNTAISAENREWQLAAIEATQKRFESLLDECQYESLRQQGEFRFSHRAFLAALFINLYRDEPMMYLPFRYLQLLLDIDQNFTAWRSRHALMVQRMLGRKIGTGGSSGYDYLNETTERNRVYLDLFSLSTFLLPRSSLPELPDDLRRELGFHFSSDQ